ncbi:DUF1616 domain-containing protein [Haladaptatus halobius]|uniref:DUF1616 domain-containing protein n=1 Tax=Haladaptatus halobius TaxID=2884875 RepID=UPI001D0ADBE0|nr:DUF1616 domain-containing protein [Haladaptatus halobius]
MSTNSRWWFVDLVVALALTIIGGFAAYIGLGGRARVALMLPLVVFLPGYVLISAMFPGGGEDRERRFGTDDSNATYALGGSERIGLAVALSVAIVPMIAAVANFTPWGVTLSPILIGIVSFTGIFTIVALVRRIRVPAERRYSPGIPRLLFGSTKRRSDNGMTAMLNVGIVISFLLVASSVGFAVFNPPQGEQFTEFYVDTKNVNSDTNTLYQTDLSGEGVTVNVGNHEGERVQYTVVAVLQRVENGNVVEQARFAEKQVPVNEGQTKQVTLTGDPSLSGDNVRLQLRLYKGNPSGEPYHRARLWLSTQNAPTQSRTSKGEEQGSNNGGETTERPQTTTTAASTTTPASTTTTASTTATTTTTTNTTPLGTTTSTTATTGTTQTTTTTTGFGTTTQSNNTAAGFGTTTQSGRTTTTDDGFLDRDQSHLNDHK